MKAILSIFILAISSIAGLSMNSPTATESAPIASGYKLNVTVAWVIPDPPFVEVEHNAFTVEKCPGTSQDCWAAFDAWLLEQPGVATSYWENVGSGPVTCPDPKQAEVVTGGPRAYAYPGDMTWEEIEAAETNQVECWTYRLQMVVMLPSGEDGCEGTKEIEYEAANWHPGSGDLALWTENVLAQVKLLYPNRCSLNWYWIYDPGGRLVDPGTCETEPCTITMETVLQFDCDLDGLADTTKTITNSTTPASCGGASTQVFEPGFVTLYNDHQNAVSAEKDAYATCVLISESRTTTTS